MPRTISQLAVALCLIFPTLLRAEDLKLKCGPVLGATVDWNAETKTTVVGTDGFDGQMLLFHYYIEKGLAVIRREGGLPGPLDDNVKIAGSEEDDAHLRATFVQIHSGVDRIFTLLVLKASRQAFLTMTENQLEVWQRQPQTRTFLMPCARVK